MLVGNFKNTTFTQSTYNCNAAVGFFMALIMRNFYPTALLADWYWYLNSPYIYLSTLTQIHRASKKKTKKDLNALSS